MAALIFFTKLFLIVIWCILVTIYGVILCYVRWGDKNLTSYWAHLVGIGVMKITGIQIEVEGRENLNRRPCVLVGNHQSAFDVASFGYIHPGHVVMVAKKELAKWPIVGTFFKASGAVLIDRDSRSNSFAKIEAAQVAFQDPRVCMGFYPEGTRNKGDGMLPFKKGAFHIAIRNKVPVVPMVSGSLKPLIDYEKKKFGPGVLKFKILEPIETANLGKEDVASLTQSTREKMLKAFYEISKT